MQGNIRKLAYVSRVRKPLSAQERISFLKQVRTANRAANISGVLFYHETFFLQYIEGEFDVLEGLMERIREDTRHDRIQVFVDSHKDEKRLFPEWEMGFHDLSTQRHGIEAEMREQLGGSWNDGLLDSAGGSTAVRLLSSFWEDHQEKASRQDQSERQHRLLEKAVAGLNDILLITEAEPIDGVGPRILFVNDAFERRTGYRREEVIGKTPRILQGEKTQRHELDRIRAALERWEPVRAELINYTKSGQEFWLELEIMPIADANGWYTHWVAVERDITERKAMEQQLVESARHTQAILDNVVDGIITIDQKGIIESFNKAACRIFGYEVEEVIGKNVSILMPEPYHSEHDGYLRNYHATGARQIIGIGREVQGRHKTLGAFPITLAVSEIVRDGKPLYIGLVSDITARRKAEAEIERLAFHDQLTELPNRRLLFDRMPRALAVSQRNGQIGALIFIDLDDFKTLNDSYGHESGDQMLVQVAARLSACVREGDTVARLGGDEFVVMIENLGVNRTDAAGNAEQVALQMLSCFTQPFDLQGQLYQGTASIGITLFGEESLSADELMGRADSAMYRAKSDGRKSYRFFDAELQSALIARATMEAALSQSIIHDELHLNYQPQIDQDGRVIGCEVLARWTHSTRGSISPVEFIPLAERTGFILELGQWVLQQACAQLAQWAGSPLTAQLDLSVNVSARQFRHPQFVQQVLDALASSGANPARLKLELTESMLVDDVDGVIEKMSLLKARGVSFSLDDFGTGFSSLSYLKRLPLDELKIDKSFVHDVLNSADDAAIARTVVALGTSLGLLVIAEGVETKGQQDFLLESGCHVFQGYLFSRPLPAPQFEQYLRGRLETA